METNIQTETRNNILVSLYRSDWYVKKLDDRPCDSCLNISRDQDCCGVCLAKDSYADSAETGVPYVKKKTGPEIIALNHKNTLPRESKEDKILRKLKFKSIEALIKELYYENEMKYVDIAYYIRASCNVCCDKNWVCNQVKAHGFNARSTKYYKK